MNKRYNRAVLAALLLFCILLAGCGGQAEVSDQIPDAPADFYVYDEAGVLSENAEAGILASNDALFATTGAQIVVACVNTTGTTDIADYVKAMFNKWGIGSAEENNGVLLLLSIWEDDYWLLQGQGLEDLLPSGTVKLMLDEHLEPYFAEQRYEEGVLALFDALCSHMESIYSVDLSRWDGTPGTFAPGGIADSAEDSEDSGALDTAMIAILIVIVILIVAAAYSGSTGGGSHGGGGKTRRTVIIPTVSYRPRYHRPTGGSHYGGRIGGSVGSFGGSRSGGFGGRSGGGGRSRGGGAGRR